MYTQLINSGWKKNFGVSKTVKCEVTNIGWEANSGGGARAWKSFSDRPDEHGSPSQTVETRDPVTSHRDLCKRRSRKGSSPFSCSVSVASHNVLVPLPALPL